MKKINKHILLVIASMGIFVEALDIAIVNLALPEIEKDLRLSAELSYKIQSMYILTYGCFLILGGRLSDFFGKKNIFLTGALIFMLTSLGAGLSHSVNVLIFCRAIQGIGAALLMPSAFSIVNYYFTEQQERSKAIGIFSSFAAIGSASGLSIGGIISSYWGWSWIFLINVPILLLLMIVAYLALDKDVVTGNSKFPDIPAAIALVTAMLCLTNATELLIAPMANLSKIVGAVLLMLASGSYLHRRLSRQIFPLLDLKLLLLSSLRLGNTLFVLLGVFFTGYLFIMSFLMQQNFGFSPAASGLIMMPFNLFSVLIAHFALPALSRILTTQRLALCGSLAMLTGALSLVVAVENHNLFFLLAGGTFIAGIGMTICFTSYSVIGMEEVPQVYLGVGGSLTTTSYLIGGGIGLPLISVFMGRILGGYISVSLWIICAVAIISIGVLSSKNKYKFRRSSN